MGKIKELSMMTVVEIKECIKDNQLMVRSAKEELREAEKSLKHFKNVLRLTSKKKVSKKIK